MSKIKLVGTFEKLDDTCFYGYLRGEPRWRGGVALIQARDPEGPSDFKVTRAGLVVGFVTHIDEAGLHVRLTDPNKTIPCDAVLAPFRNTCRNTWMLTKK